MKDSQLTTSSDHPTATQDPSPAAALVQPWSNPPPPPPTSADAEQPRKLGESSKTALFPAAPERTTAAPLKRSRLDAFTTRTLPRRTRSESGSGHRRRHRRLDRGLDDRLVIPGTPLPFDLNNPCIPPLHPPVNQSTLRELELDSILRNPQLRHDLLFDSGLQFRPTANKQKLETVESYWAALSQELSTGCTCQTFTGDQRPTALRCICLQVPKVPSEPMVVVSPLHQVYTVRMPSRVRPLLAELLAVLLSIIQPLPAACQGVYMTEPTSSPAGVRRQNIQYASQAAALQAALDADLIVQELEHKLFNPVGLFRVVGDILKHHCAPMRDQLVDAVVAAAERVGPGECGSYDDAVIAMRMLWTVLETMKLDIANHQLVSLRPWLVQSAPEYELRLLHERYHGPEGLAHTKKWVGDAHRALASANAPIYAGAPMKFGECAKNTQLRIATLRAIAGLVFEPVAVAEHPHALLIPETLHLDYARLHEIGSACADLTALWMLLSLFRQLANAKPLPACSCGGQRTNVTVDSNDLSGAKRDVWNIGPSKPGLMLWRPLEKGATPSASASSLERERTRWERKTKSATLELARRAAKARLCPRCSCASEEEVVPPQESVQLAESWAMSNLRRGSPLAVLMARRLREAVVDVLLVALSQGQGKPVDELILALPSVSSAGLECLLREVKHLADKIWRLANIHVNVYGSLYEDAAFLEA